MLPRGLVLLVRFSIMCRSRRLDRGGHRINNATLLVVVVPGEWCLGGGLVLLVVVSVQVGIMGIIRDCLLH